MNFNETPEQEAIINKLIFSEYKWKECVERYVWSEATITREQFEARDGWITWKGESDKPRNLPKHFEFIRRDGEIYGGELADDWRHKGYDYDIMAYRAVTHPHAALIMEFAELAQTDPEPHRQFQYVSEGGVHTEMVGGQGFHRDATYRRKPRTKLIHGQPVPDISFVPVDGDRYFHPEPTIVDLCRQTFYVEGSQGDALKISNNLCYPPTDEGREAAILHAKAWLEL